MHDTTTSTYKTASGSGGGAWANVADGTIILRADGTIIKTSSGAVNASATFTQYNYFLSNSIAYVINNATVSSGVLPKANYGKLVAINLDDSATTKAANKLFELDNAFSGYSIGSRDGSVVTINRNGGTARLLVADGIAQDARAPRGTLVYTDQGVRVRTGLSQTQVENSVSGTRADTWA